MEYTNIATVVFSLITIFYAFRVKYAWYTSIILGMSAGILYHLLCILLYIFIVMSFEVAGINIYSKFDIALYIVQIVILILWIIYSQRRLRKTYNNRHIKKWTAILLCGFLFIFIAYELLINPWSKINCYTKEINISSGQQRYTRYYGYIPFIRNTEDTWISEILERPNARKKWKLVVTLRPQGGNSPHYAFHSALSDVYSAETSFKCFKFSEEAKKQIAENIIFLLNAYGNDSQVSEYLYSIICDKKFGQTIGVSDLPDFRTYLEQILEDLLESNKYNPFFEKHKEATIEKYEKIIKKYEATLDK